MKISKRKNNLWHVLPLCLCLAAAGLAACNDGLEADVNQNFYSRLFEFQRMADGDESNLLSKDELPEWMIPIVTAREEKDPSTAVFATEINGKLMYNIYYFSKISFTFGRSSDHYVDFYYSDGTPIDFLTGPGTEAAYQPEMWCMVYCAHPELYRYSIREELVEKDKLPGWMIGIIDSCATVAVDLLIRDDKQAYSILGTYSDAVLHERSMFFRVYLTDGTRCTDEETRYFLNTRDHCFIYLRE